MRSGKALLTLARVGRNTSKLVPVDIPTNEIAKAPLVLKEKVVDQTDFVTLVGHKLPKGSRLKTHGRCSLSGRKSMGAGGVYR